MKLIVDTREKKWDHIRSHFDSNNIQYDVKKVEFGDYRLEPDTGVHIEHKANLQELLTNTCSADKKRFYDEIKGAKDAKVKLIILCEHSNRIKCISDVAKWKSKYSKVTGKQLSGILKRLQAMYGVEIVFTDKVHCGEMIVKLLSESE